MAEAPTAPLEAVTNPQCSLALHVRRVTGSVVGRPVELGAIEQELASARTRMACLTVEGEPGIGKTRLLLAAEEVAAAQGFVGVGVIADEEIRGPFLLARSIFTAPPLVEAAAGTRAEGAVRRVAAAIAGRDEPGLENLSLDQKLLRTFDLAAVAFSALASMTPVALIIDDLQWADEDSLRMLRYLVRTDPSSPIFLMMSIRPEEMALVNEAVTLIADMERMGLVRRLKMGRFTQVETAQLLEQTLGGKVNITSAAAMHAQSEGVPFIVEEMARAYRDAGMLQQIDGVWSLARNAERLVPSAVRTLIQRRSARLPERTKVLLAQAAILGRTFSLKDLAAVEEYLGEPLPELEDLAEAFSPAVSAGLLRPQPPGAPADYAFMHEQVREFAAAALSAARRRGIHRAIVALLTAGGEPSPDSLPLVARHALAAGEAEQAARFSIDAARQALAAHAPEEVLRVVDLALPAASMAQDRLALLTARDDALEMLRRAGDRLEGLAELAALAEAMGDDHLELEVMLRRAAALRVSDDCDAAADLARRVRDLASRRGDGRAELAACLELGQDLLRVPLGEGYVPTASEVDLDGAEETLRRAAAIAQDLGDDANLAAALREIGTIFVGRIRAWFVQEVQAGRQLAWLERLAAGETLQEMLPTLEIAPLVSECHALYERALEIYERLGDRRGVMSTVIATAYISWAPDIHLTSSVRYIDEIRRLTSRMTSFTRESERALAEVQMLYGSHVFARAKVVPDLALARGEEAYRRARTTGERSVEFAAAGGVALTHLELGETEQAEAWLDRAASAAASEPTPLRARQLEVWRGMAGAVAGDAAGMLRHLERSVRLASDQGLPAARCETLARLALETARLGAKRRDEELLSLAQRYADEARHLAVVLPGHPPWSAQAEAADASVALARGNIEAATRAGRKAMAALQEALREDLNLDILLPAARAMLAGGQDEEKAETRHELQLLLSTIAQRIVDEDVRVRWFRGPVGRELTTLAGPIEAPAAAATHSADGDRDLHDEDVVMIRLILQGHTNGEIAEELSISEAEVTRRLAQTFARIGASSRAEATAFAFRQGVV